ncbi:MAG: hypothetical protein PHN82_07125 [bacterium]|nr:hypothetical protein [bacterium]
MTRRRLTIALLLAVAVCAAASLGGCASARHTVEDWKQWYLTDVMRW